MSESYKILHVITTTMVGGAEVQLLQLLNGNDPQRFRHTVVGLTHEGPLAESMRQTGAEVISLGLKPNLTALYKGIIRIVGIIKKIKPHLVQGWMYHANLLALISARLCGVRPVIWGVFCSNMEMDKYSTGSRLLFKACALTAKQPAAIVSNTISGIEFHVGLGYPRNTQTVIPNGFDTQRYAPNSWIRDEVRTEMGLGEEHLLIGKVARFDPMKDHKTLFAAFSEVLRDFPQARLITLGLNMEQGNPKLRVVEVPPLAGRVFLIGRRQDVPRWLQAMDVHVSSSAFGEGLSNAVGEAMACGVPNVVTDVGDSARLVSDTGVIVPPRQYKALAAALKAILSLSPAERQKLGLCARQRIKRHYSVESMVQAYQQLYYQHIRPLHPITFQD